MTNILIVSKNNNSANELTQFLNEYKIDCTSFYFEDEDKTVNFIKENNFTIIIVDDDIENSNVLLKKIKNADNENNIITCLLYSKDTFNDTSDFTGFVDTFIQKPVSKNILVSTINSYIKIKKNIDKYKNDNKELNKSLYQLDVLYNTNSQLSGNLDKEKVYEIMFETLEKTLSFDTSCALMYPTPFNKHNKPDTNRLIIHSLKKPQAEILDILKEKLKDYAKDYNTDTDFSNILVEEHIKPSYQNQTYDISLLNFDKLIAPIKVKDETFGVISIYRNKPFSKEDVVCFQSIIHQIASPLRIINLYDEKNSNIETLKKLERIKSEFVSIVSHELRTPLTPMNLSLDFLASKATDEASKKSIDMAKRNVLRLTGMIEDLLDLSRIETGKFSFDYKRYNIKSSLELTAKTFEGQAKNKNMDFSITMDDNLPDIYADSKRLEQILSNLTNNAFKFTPNGGKIIVSAKLIDASDINKTLLIEPVEPLQGQYINISIKDTGLGIKEENIHKIFNKFSQIENSLTRNAGGIGLGLTITKNFIDAHLGAIWVLSKENEGSDFNVVIPIYSETKAFNIELNEAKKTSDTTSVLTLKSKTSLNSFVEKLKEENIIKPLKSSKEIFFKKEDSKEFIYKIYFKNLQKSALDFITSQITSKINSPEFRSCGIVLEKDIFKKEDEIHPI